MSDADLHEKLTPAARQALDELVEDYKSEILRRAGESAAGLTGEVREVSVHDIFRGVAEFQRRGVARPRTLVERVLTMYTITGLVLGAVGLLYYVSQGLLVGPPRTQLPLLFAFAGFTIAAMSFAVVWLRQTRERREFTRRLLGPTYHSDAGSEFISRWRELELSLRNVVATDLGESVASGPLSVLIGSLVERGRISKEDSVRITELLEIRNRLVHLGELADREELRKAMGFLEKVLHRLRR